MAQPSNHLSRGIGDGSPQRPHTAAPSPNLRDQYSLAQSNGQRHMPPPSPQSYHQRYLQQTPSNGALGSGGRDPPPPYHRPKSSMSILSMLGSESDPSRDHVATGSAGSTPLYNPRNTNDMSPPHPVGKEQMPSSFISRIDAPDPMGISNLIGGRPARSASGGVILGPRPFEESTRAPHTTFARFGEAPGPALDGRRTEEADRERRTSISGILQRPSSQPQVQSHPTYPGPTPHSASLARRPPWGEHGSIPGANAYGTHPTPANGFQRPAEPKIDYPRPNPTPSTTPTHHDARTGVYGPPLQPPPTEREIQPRTNTWDRAANSASPEVRRPAGGGQFKPLAGLLNGQSPSPVGRNDGHGLPMTRHDSAQSHGERASLSDRLEKGRTRRFSPFASSHASHSQPPGSLSDEKSRKGSDELSQHRAILALSAEGKKGGRFSPLPQAVQGAQPQSVPEVGVKTEGRIFAGIGSGAGNVSSPMVGPTGLAASPFKHDGASRLNDDNLLKLSRSSSDMGKRPRKFKEDDGKASSETEGHVRGVKRPRNHHHHHRAGHTDLASPFDLQGRNSPLAGLNPIRRTSTPTNAHAHHGPHHHHHRPHHHHHHQTNAPRTYRPTKYYRIKPVIELVSVHKRRHLGSFLYDPIVQSSTLNLQKKTKLGYAVHPNILPCFNELHQLNCTYTVRVPRTWLQQDQREAICAERFLWGTGLYSDDSDPVAAAIHSGFIKAAWPESIDTALLEDIIKSQNPQIDYTEGVPSSPLLPPADKDLHITMLVLPPLDGYPASSRFGISSRSWSSEKQAAPHDGMSFAVLKCEWVDEGMGRAQERTGEATRKRIQAMAVFPPEGYVAKPELDIFEPEDGGAVRESVEEVEVGEKVKGKMDG